MRTSLFTLALIPVLAAAAAAQGLVIPVEPDVPPLALTRHKVTVDIESQAAVTTVEQIFQNNTERQLEAHYVFPIPKGAVLTRFTMLVNGKEQEGALVEKTEARRIYNQIVSRAQDPGLLEYLGGDVFRANIFPILPRSSQTITLRFSQVVPAEGSLVSYTYPVRASAKRGPTVHGEFSIEATVKSPAPMRNLYSPSHAVAIARKNDREARVTFASRGASLDKDFQLFWGLDPKDVGLHVVTYRPDPREPGYFMMLVSPNSELQAKRIVERDIVFVMDVSGSMAGDKIKQARAALKYCVNSLNDGDRFNIVPFSSFAEPWKKELVGAAAERKAALAFADTLLAQGGTDIAGALDAALSFPRTSSRPYYIMFMTDGKPTLGETTDPKKILAKAEKAKGDVRLFTWGVGYDVDTQLLDAMAETCGGVSEYVRPAEDIEAKVSAFYAKASRPVLTGLELAVVGDKVQLANFMPRAIPDLYAGGQLVLMGRYTGSGDVALRLTGRVNEAAETFTYEAGFAAEDKKHGFIEPLWAKRRIGALLDQIRMHGETKELVDDVIRLSKEYGIQTPYTSYLILEDGRQMGAAAPAGGTRGAMDRAEAEKRRDVEGKLAVARPEAPKPEPAAAPAVKAAEDAAREEHNALAKSVASGFGKKDGKDAVETASYLRRLKEADKGEAFDRSLVRSRKSAGRTFYALRDLWVDDAFEAADKTTLVKFGSPAYFRLLELRPELAEIFKVSVELVVRTSAGKALVITTTGGAETLSDPELTGLFAK
ncbi:MAG TPA: VIT domain-containing protein [Planctomycetota bacterium]